MEQTCCFTGHRPDKLPFGGREQHPDCLELKERLAGEIIAMREQGITRFLSGMALGTDLWAAEAVLRLKQRDPGVALVAVIPFTGQASRWSPRNRRRYEAVLAQADETVLIRPYYTSGCMFERNRFLVEHAAHMIAVYDGTPGGTAYTVGYARQLERHIVLIDPGKCQKNRQ